MPNASNRRVSAERLRITTVIDSLQRAGAERVMVALCNEWSRLGHHVTLITLAPRKAGEFELDPKVARVALNIRLPHSKFEAIRSVTREVFGVRRAIVRSHPDVVLSFNDVTNVKTLLATSTPRIPVFVAEHGNPLVLSPPPIWDRLRKWTYGRAAGIVMLTEDARVWAQQAFPHTPSVVMPNPIRPVCDGPALSFGAPTIVAIGRLCDQKGFDILIQAFEQCAAKLPDWQVAIVGSGPLRGQLEQQAVAAGLADRIAFLGHLDDPDSALRAASLFVMPSRFEGFGLVLAEALSLGVAAIASDCPSGPSEIVSDRENGILVPPENPEALAAAIYELAVDQTLRSQLGSAGITVRERFAVETIAARYLEVLRGTVA